MGTRSDLRAAVHQDRVAHGRCVDCGAPTADHFAFCPRRPQPPDGDEWSGLTLIADERLRQIIEHYDSEHDREANAEGQLIEAAWCYLGYSDEGDVPYEWPWGSDAWKPTPDDPIRRLVKAGALIAAEIDRRLAERGR